MYFSHKINRLFQIIRKNFSDRDMAILLLIEVVELV
jgi:hypothetical protein